MDRTGTDVLHQRRELSNAISLMGVRYERVEEVVRPLLVPQTTPGTLKSTPTNLSTSLVGFRGPLPTAERSIAFSLMGVRYECVEEVVRPLAVRSSLPGSLPSSPTRRRECPITISLIGVRYNHVEEVVRLLPVPSITPGTLTSSPTNLATRLVCTLSS